MYNTFGKTNKVYDAGKAIWHRIVSVFPIGGTITNLSGFSAGSIIPSGTPAYLNTAASQVTVVATPTYDSSAKYAVGDKVIYGGKFYRCASAITTPEDWTAAHWTEIVGGVANIPDYSTSATYAVGDKCKHSSKYYVCSTAIQVAEAWTAGHWTETNAYDADYDTYAACNGLLRDDIVVDSASLDATYGGATGAVVFEGVVLSSRLIYGVPDFVWANLTNITQYKEA